MQEHQSHKRAKAVASAIINGWAATSVRQILEVRALPATKEYPMGAFLITGKSGLSRLLDVTDPALKDIGRDFSVLIGRYFVSLADGREAIVDQQSVDMALGPLVEQHINNPVEC